MSEGIADKAMMLVTLGGLALGGLALIVGAHRPMTYTKCAEKCGALGVRAVGVGFDQCVCKTSDQIDGGCL